MFLHDLYKYVPIVHGIVGEAKVYIAQLPLMCWVWVSVGVPLLAQHSCAACSA